MVNLRDGAAIDSFGARDAIDGFEVVFGTRFADIFVGGAGNETFTGGAGGDIFNAGAGFDVVDYGAETGARGVIVNLGAGVAIDSHGDRDRLSGVEGIIGGRGGDLLVGGAAGESLDGGAGNDTLVGRGGNDTLIGGDGVDVADYAVDGGAGGVVVNLRDGVAADSHGAMDVLVSVESAIGTRFADVFVGGAGDDTFAGGDGADTINGGAGFDTANYAGDRGAGSDLVDYAADPAGRGVIVNLRDGAAIDGHGARDTLIGIERARGGDGNDVFVGSAADNEFEGGAGDDTLSGGDGLDVALYAGARADFALRWNADTAQLMTIDLNAADGLDEGVDLLSGIEALIFDGVLHTLEELIAAASGPAAPTPVATAVREDLAPGGTVATLGGAGGHPGMRYEIVDAEGRPAEHAALAVTGAALTLKQGAALDFETAPTLSVFVRAMERWSVSAPVAVTIEVLDVAEAIFLGDGGETWRESGVAETVVHGGAGADWLHGGDGADRLHAGAGDDYLEGGAGADTLIGGAGADTAGFDAEDVWRGVVVDLAGGWAEDGHGFRDLLIGVEDVDGTRFDDTLLGDDGDNYFKGGRGADFYDGRGGDGDQVDFRDGAEQGVAVDLAAGTAIDQFGLAETLVNIEGVRGTLFADLIAGDDGANQFTGLGGDDTLDGRGGDRDLVRYDRDARYGGAGAATVNLAEGWAIDGFGDRDTLIGVERARGTASGDRFIAGDAAAWFDGREGDDRFEGGAGRDLFIGGAGADTMIGGAGGATADYSRETGGRSIHVDLRIGAAWDTHRHVDTLTDVRHVIGTALGDRFISVGAGPASFVGGAGGDIYIGGATEDLASYERAERGVFVDLEAGYALDGQGGTDVLVRVEQAAPSTTR